LEILTTLSVTGAVLFLVAIVVAHVARSDLDGKSATLSLYLTDGTRVGLSLGYLAFVMSLVTLAIAVLLAGALTFQALVLTSCLGITSCALVIVILSSRVSLVEPDARSHLTIAVHRLSALVAFCFVTAGSLVYSVLVAVRGHIDAYKGAKLHSYPLPFLLSCFAAAAPGTGKYRKLWLPRRRSGFCLPRSTSKAYEPPSDFDNRRIGKACCYLNCGFL
jgi:hypothetical protein